MADPNASKNNTPNTQQGPPQLPTVRPVFVEYACGHNSAFTNPIPVFHPAARIAISNDGVIRINDGQTRCIVCNFNDRVVTELQKQQQVHAAQPQAVTDPLDINAK